MKATVNSLKRVNIYLLIFGSVYFILNAWHTKLLLATGQMYEVNAVINYFIENYGPNSLFLIKVFLLAVLSTFIYILHKRVDKDLI